MITLSNYKDVDDGSLPYIKQFYSYINSGQIDAANAYFKENASILKPRQVNAESFNKIEREIQNSQTALYYKQKVIKSKTQPDTDKYQLSPGSLWLKEY